METRAFDPLYVRGTPYGRLLSSVSVTPNNTTATLTPVFSGNNYNKFVQMRVANTTTAWAYVEFSVFGNVPTATVATSLPIQPGWVEIFTISTEVTGASVILGAATTGGTTVIFTRGEGL